MNLYMIKTLSADGGEAYRYVVADSLQSAAEAARDVVAVSLVSDMLVFASPPPAVDKRH